VWAEVERQTIFGAFDVETMHFFSTVNSKFNDINFTSDTVYNIMYVEC